MVQVYAIGLPQRAKIVSGFAREGGGESVPVASRRPGGILRHRTPQTALGRSTIDGGKKKGVNFIHALLVFTPNRRRALSNGHAGPTVRRYGVSTTCVDYQRLHIHARFLNVLFRQYPVQVVAWLGCIGSGIFNFQS